MKNKKVEIEFCPICGSKPVLEKHSLDYGNGHGYPEHYNYEIKCISCGIPTPQSADTVYRNSDLEAIESALKKWNNQSKFIINEYLLKNPYLKELIKKEDE